MFLQPSFLPRRECPERKRLAHQLDQRGQQTHQLGATAPVGMPVRGRLMPEVAFQRVEQRRVGLLVPPSLAALCSTRHPQHRARRDASCSRPCTSCSLPALTGRRPSTRDRADALPRARR